MTISEKIRSLREALGLTQAEAAKQLGMSLRAYKAHELGERTTRPLRRYEIAGILSIYAQLKAGYAAAKKRRS